jgi:hypothetical protein
MATALFAAPLGIPCFKSWLTSGVPNAGGKVSIYYAGTSVRTTAYPTQADALAGTNSLTNPVTLDAYGESQIWLQSSIDLGTYYKVVVADSSSVVLTNGTMDNINPALSYSYPTINAWVPEVLPFAYVAATQFKITGYDQSSVYHVGRRVKINNGSGTIYVTVTAVAFASDTTVTVVGGTVLNTLTAISYGVEPYTNPAHLDPRTVIACIKNGDLTGFGSATKVTTWTEQIDSNAEFASDKFTCVYPGYYRVDVAAEISDTVASQDVIVSIYKNGAEVKKIRARSAATGGNHTSIVGGHDLNLANGDYIEMYVTGTVNTTVYGTTGSAICVRRIP